MVVFFKEKVLTHYTSSVFQINIQLIQKYQNNYK